MLIVVKLLEMQIKLNQFLALLLLQKVNASLNLWSSNESHLVFAQK